MLDCLDLDHADELQSCQSQMLDACLLQMWRCRHKYLVIQILSSGGPRSPLNLVRMQATDPLLGSILLKDFKNNTRQHSDATLSWSYCMRGIIACIHSSQLAEYWCRWCGDPTKCAKTELTINVYMQTNCLIFHTLIGFQSKRHPKLNSFMFNKPGWYCSCMLKDIVKFYSQRCGNHSEWVMMCIIDTNVSEYSY